MPQSTTSLTIPSQLDRAHTALAQASTDFERITIRDQAKAVEAAAAILDRRDIQVQASVLVQRAERAISKANPPKPEGGDKRSSAYRNTVPQGDSVLSIPKLRDMRAVHSKLSDTQFEARTVQAIESETPLTRQSLKIPAHVSHNSGEIEWYTPLPIIEAARGCMGGIDLDPASSEKAQETVGAGSLFTAEDDGLSQPWAGRVFLNPPYESKLVGPFVEKLLSEPVEQAIILVNNATETKWGQALLERADSVCFPSGRIQFLDSEGIPKQSPLQGQMIIGIGVEVESFRREFQNIGAVLCVK